jgi:hypothetical protein
VPVVIAAQFCSLLVLTYARAVMALVQISTERELRLRATLNLMGLRVRVHIHLPVSLFIDRV